MHNINKQDYPGGHERREISNDFIKCLRNFIKCLRSPIYQKITDSIVHFLHDLGDNRSRLLGMPAPPMRIAGLILHRREVT